MQIFTAMKKREFINEDALSLWDAMTRDEKSNLKGGKMLTGEELSKDADSDGSINVSITWSNVSLF